LGRSLLPLMTIVAELNARGVAFRSIAENIDTGPPVVGCSFMYPGLLQSLSAHLSASELRLAWHRPRLGEYPWVDHENFE
jgi:DNA invertase Pin-like site-specific DNA recombinase